MKLPPRAQFLVLGLALLVGTFSIDGAFVYDDPRALRENPIVNGALPAMAAFDHDFWGAPLTGKVRSYRPLMPLVWRGLWAVFPNQPLPFRVLSLVLHVLATLMVFRLLTRMLKVPGSAVAGAVLFAVHPVHAEAVGAIVSHADLLAALLGFVVLDIGLSTARRAGLAAACLLLACAAKESAVVFGAALVLKAALESKALGLRLPIARVLPVASVMLAVIGFQLSLERTGGIVLPDSLARSLEGSLRVLYGFHAIGKGASLVFVPYGLTPHRGYAVVQPAVDSLVGFALVGVLVLLLLAFFSWRAWLRRDASALAVIALFVGPLLLQSGFFVTPMTDVVDRLLYAPSLCASYVLSSALARVGAQRIVRWLLPTLLFVLTLLSLEAQRAWTSNLALWERAVMVEPASWQAQKNVAAYLTQVNRAPHAAWHFLLSLYIVRQYPNPIDLSPIHELQELPLGERLDSAPFVLEPKRPCDLIRVYLTNMRRSAPQVAAQLESRYAEKGCVLPRRR